MHTELGPASHYFSTILMRPPNRRPNAHNFFALVSLLTVMRMADPCLFTVICASLSQSLLIYHCGTIFSCIPVNDSSCFKSSILPSPRYLSRGIPCTFNCCQCSNISTLTTAWSTIFSVRMSKFDSRGISNPAFACPVCRADTAPDGTYFTQIQQVFSPFLAFCNALFNASIKSVSDFC